MDKWIGHLEPGCVLPWLVWPLRNNFRDVESGRSLVYRQYLPFHQAGSGSISPCRTRCHQPLVTNLLWQQVGQLQNGLRQRRKVLCIINLCASWWLQTQRQQPPCPLEFNRSLERKLVQLGIYPAVDPVSSSCPFSRNRRRKNTMQSLLKSSL